MLGEDVPQEVVADRVGHDILPGFVDRGMKDHANETPPIIRNNTMRHVWCQGSSCILSTGMVANNPVVLGVLFGTNEGVDYAVNYGIFYSIVFNQRKVSAAARGLKPLNPTQNPKPLTALLPGLCSGPLLCSRFIIVMVMVRTMLAFYYRHGQDYARYGQDYARFITTTRAMLAVRD